LKVSCFVVEHCEHTYLMFDLHIIVSLNNNKWWSHNYASNLLKFTISSWCFLLTRYLILSAIYLFSVQLVQSFCNGSLIYDFLTHLLNMSLIFKHYLGWVGVDIVYILLWCSRNKMLQTQCTRSSSSTMPKSAADLRMVLHVIIRLMNAIYAQLIALHVSRKSGQQFYFSTVLNFSKRSMMPV